jgi:phage FluMu protein Com
MITIRRLMIVLAAVSLSLGAIAGCKGKESEGAGNKDNRFAGKYYNDNDPQEYIDLKVDGRFFRRSRSSLGVASVAGEYTEETGKWQVDGNEIVFIGPVGDVDRAQIANENVITIEIDTGGGKELKGFIKQGQVKKPGQKISKDALVGRYIFEFEESAAGKEPQDHQRLQPYPSAFFIFKKDGTIEEVLSGRWEVARNGKEIEFYAGDKKVGKGDISGSVSIEQRGNMGTRIVFTKKGGAKSFVQKGENVTVWSDYVSQFWDMPDVRDHAEEKRFSLNLTKHGAFLMSGYTTTWKIEGGFVKLVYTGAGQEEVTNWSLESDAIVCENFDEGKRIIRRFIKEDQNVPGRYVFKGRVVTEMIWVKCAKCNQSYQIGPEQYYKEQEEKTRANPSPMPVALPLKCQKCGQDGVRKAFKCEKCGEVFFANSVQGDLEDRCAKCKYSKTEAEPMAARVVATEHLKIFALAAIMYADDNEGRFARGVGELKPYLRDESRFAWIIKNVEYVASGRRYRDMSSTTPLAYWKTAPTTAQGTAVAFLDRHVEFVAADRLAELGIKREP